MAYLPSNKDIIEPPHKCVCSKCNRRLTTGIGYFVIDEKGFELPVGPDCFEAWTGLPKSKAPVLALGAVKEEGGASKRRKAADEFTEASRTPFETRRKIAEENVLLRAEKLPAKGFTNTDAALFAEFLSRRKMFTPDDVKEIEQRVAAVKKDDPNKELSNLMRCNTVYGQIQRLLTWKDGRFVSDEKLLKMRDQLCRHNGLVDWQMEKVSRWSAAAERNGIENSVDGIHFSPNQARYDKYLQRKLP